jgi:hypothetical protein
VLTDELRAGLARREGGEASPSRSRSPEQEAAPARVFDNE